MWPSWILFWHIAASSVWFLKQQRDRKHSQWLFSLRRKWNWWGIQNTHLKHRMACAFTLLIHTLDSQSKVILHMTSGKCLIVLCFTSYFLIYDLLTSELITSLKASLHICYCFKTILLERLSVTVECYGCCCLNMICLFFHVSL